MDELYFTRSRSRARTFYHKCCLESLIDPRRQGNRLRPAVPDVVPVSAGRALPTRRRQQRSYGVAIVCRWVEQSMTYWGSPTSSPTHTRCRPTSSPSRWSGTEVCYRQGWQSRYGKSTLRTGQFCRTDLTQSAQIIIVRCLFVRYQPLRSTSRQAGATYEKTNCRLRSQPSQIYVRLLIAHEATPGQGMGN